MTEKRLTRSRGDRIIAGVCGGLAKYFGLDPVLIRVIFLIALLGFGTGLLPYLVLWIVMPNEN
ncbi:MAG: PspC domain-containing protein [Cytophagales bacterium]|nr:PspC domain-containing protein [Hyphobacterium sp. CCMP332]